MKKLFVFLLSVIVCGMLVGCQFDGMIFNITEYTYLNSENYIEYSEFVERYGSETTFKTINVDWIAGDINIREGNSFDIAEYCEKEDYPPMYALLDGDELTVKYCKSGTQYMDLNNFSKTLEITVLTVENVKVNVISSDYSIELSDINGVEVDAVSGDGNVTLNNVKTAKFDLVSGSIDLLASECEKVKMNTVSGCITVSLSSVKEVDFDTTSGVVDLTVESSLALSKIDFDSISGDFTAKLDGLKGFDLSFDTISGKKSLAFTDGSDHSIDNFKMDFDSISGNLTVIKL